MMGAATCRIKKRAEPEPRPPMTEKTAAAPEVPAEAPPARRIEDLPPAARRALEEAEARRAAASDPALPPEVRGRGGLEPVRYGDWEIKGLAADF
jgi:hypothetical protein